MRLAPTVRLASRAILRNKLRSFLTALGIIIGVSAVIAMVAIGAGAKKRVEQTFEAMGTNLLVVMSGSSAGGGLRGGFGTQPTLTWDDVRAIGSELSAVRAVAPVLRGGSTVQSDDQNWTTSVAGTSADYFAIRNAPIASGRAFEAGDVEGNAKVVVLGQTVADKLFGPEARVVGRVVRIKRVPFEVIGVLSKKGQSPMGQDYDDIVLLPWTTFQTRIQGGLGKYVAGALFVSATSSETTRRAQNQITALLRDRHRLPPGTDDDFSVRDLSEIASAQEEGTRVLTALLASIAAVALLVGGIGIMNIMLVSVTERTREIGLRMSVGARRRDILLQFMVEALTLALTGGTLGIAAGVLAGRVLAAHFQWPMIVDAGTVLLAVGFSAAVGLVFGLYPARKASRFDPIEALRYE